MCFPFVSTGKRKQPATLLLRALGIAETREEIIELLGDSEMVIRTLDRDPATTKEESLIELYRRFRPGEPPTIDSARTLLDGLFFNPQRCGLRRLGRYKINKKLGFDPENDNPTLTQEDIIETMRYIVALHDGEEGYHTDDIDHFGNRRIRTVGELIQNQFRIGLSRMERVVRERMSMQEPDDITPQSLVNIRPIVAAIKEFFGSSQLSQFMDQTNPRQVSRTSVVFPRSVLAAFRVSAQASRSATFTPLTMDVCARSRPLKVLTSA